MQRLVLFDIDGTILDSGGTAAKAFLAALLEVFGMSPSRHGYSFGGKTDPQIARDLLSRAGIRAEEIDRGLPRVWQSYLTRLEHECLPERVSVYPGVTGLLDHLHDEPAAVLGLLTGNLREGARLKLTAAGVDFDRFVAGAYGSDHPDRSNLPVIAIDRAESRVGKRFEGKDVVIVGDTPFDISCGEHLGVRTIAVATGSYGAEDLAVCKPDYLFESLEKTDEVLDAIFG
jgi:phosphoglycolate phosphatase